MYGSNYVPVPYSPVEAYSAPNDVVIPSGGTSVSGYWYYWNEGGFIGSGWHYPQGPTKFFNSEEEIYEEISSRTPPNMNNEFAQWEKELTSLDPDDATREAYAFESAVANSSLTAIGTCIVKILN